MAYSTTTGLLPLGKTPSLHFCRCPVLWTVAKNSDFSLSRMTTTAKSVSPNHLIYIYHLEGKQSPRRKPKQTQGVCPDKARVCSQTWVICRQHFHRIQQSRVLPKRCLAVWVYRYMAHLSTVCLLSVIPGLCDWPPSATSGCIPAKVESGSTSHRMATAFIVGSPYSTHCWHLAEHCWTTCRTNTSLPDCQILSKFV